MQDDFAKSDEWATCPYHCSLRLFTMVRRSLCGPLACWISARTSSLVTWSLYEFHPRRTERKFHSDVRRRLTKWIFFGVSNPSSVSNHFFYPSICFVLRWSCAFDEKEACLHAGADWQSSSVSQRVVRGHLKVWYEGMLNSYLHFDFMVLALEGLA